MFSRKWRQSTSKKSLCALTAPQEYPTSWAGQETLLTRPAFAQPFGNGRTPNLAALLSLDAAHLPTVEMLETDLISSRKLRNTRLPSSANTSRFLWGGLFLIGCRVFFCFQVSVSPVKRGNRAGSSRNESDYSTLGEVPRSVFRSSRVAVATNSD